MYTYGFEEGGHFIAVWQQFLFHHNSTLKSILPVDAVLMAEGKGERLRSLTEKTPKPLLPVGNKAIIDHNVDRLISYGINHISVTVNYLKEQIEEHYKEPRNDVKVLTVREPKYLGTIGSVKFATRSFIDEFYNLFMKTPDTNTFRVELTNVPTDIKAMLDAVNRTQVRAKVIPSHSQEVAFKNVTDFLNYFSKVVL